MATKTRSELLAQQAALWPDNTVRDITPAELREGIEDLVEAVPNLTDDGNLIVSAFLNDMRTLPVSVLNDKTVVFMKGYHAVGDKGAGLFRFSAASTAADDGWKTIRPTAISEGNPGRLIREYNGPVHSRWFGCKADNSFDDSGALQTAIYAAENGTLVLDSGEYILTTTMDLPEKIRIIGGVDGPVSLRLNFNGPAFRFYDPNQVPTAIHFEDLRLVSNRVTYPACVAFSLVDSNGGTIKNVKIENFNQGVYIGPDSADWHLTNVTVDNPASANSGFFIDAPYCTLNNCISRNSAVGVRFHQYAQECSITGGEITGGSSTSAITTHSSSFGLSIKNVKMSAQNGINLSGPGAVIQACEIRGFVAGTGIELSSSVQDTRIVGNLIDQFDVGINDLGSGNLWVTDNVIEANSAAVNVNNADAVVFLSGNMFACNYPTVGTAKTVWQQAGYVDYSPGNRYTNLAGTITWPPKIDGGTFEFKSVSYGNAIGSYRSGELVEGTLNFEDAIALTSGVLASIMTASLGDGVWDVEGWVAFQTSVEPSIKTVTTGISLSSSSFDANARPLNFGVQTSIIPSTTAFGNLSLAAPVRRVTVAPTPTGVPTYLLAGAEFSSGTCVAWGHLRAKRV